MSTREKINSAMKEAMKNKDMERLAAIRLITAALKDKVINSRTEGRNDGVDEGTIMSMLQSMIKQRTESSKIFRENNRPELAEKEEKEMAIIEEFLPALTQDTSKAYVEEEHLHLVADPVVASIS